MIVRHCNSEKQEQERKRYKMRFTVRVSFHLIKLLLHIYILIKRLMTDYPFFLHTSNRLTRIIERNCRRSSSVIQKNPRNSTLNNSRPVQEQLLH